MNLELNDFVERQNDCVFGGSKVSICRRIVRQNLQKRRQTWGLVLAAIDLPTSLATAYSTVRKVNNDIGLDDIIFSINICIGLIFRALTGLLPPGAPGFSTG